MLVTGQNRAHGRNKLVHHHMILNLVIFQLASRYGHAEVATLRRKVVSLFKGTAFGSNTLRNLFLHHEMI
jgi:hypothetical protein